MKDALLSRQSTLGCRMHRVENRMLFSITVYENINMFSLNPEIAQELVPTQAKKISH
jgi:hypothetical protein